MSDSIQRDSSMEVPASTQHRDDIIGRCAQHKVLPNLVMIIMFLAGGWGLYKLNIQFFPNFGLDFINVTVAWPGAAPEDVEQGIVNPLEERFLQLDDIKKVNSTAYRGVGNIWIEYEEGTDINAAKDAVQSAIEQVRNLPESAETPEVRKIIYREDVARVVLTSTASDASGIKELRNLAKTLEDELLELGLSDVNIRGLPEEEINIAVPAQQIARLGMPLNQLAESINTLSQDIPAGNIGGGATERQLRSTGQRRSIQDFKELTLRTNANELVQLDDIATVTRDPVEGSSKLYFDGVQAIELNVQRSADADALEMSEILQGWLDKTTPLLPPGVELHIYDERWKHIDQRIDLLLWNGLTGLILIIAILLIFLNPRVAFWVTIGIPTSFALTLLILYLLGGTINMISLFALIMALGIIVDDAIVVGEDGYAHYQMGERSLQAAEGGARRMLAPVMASSMTTIAAFLPLMMIGGYMGSILFEIPLVIICVILASLVESFIVLPGHLRKTFHQMNHRKERPYRQKIDAAFDRFRDGPFTRFIELCLRYRIAVFATVIVSFVLTIGSLATGHVKFTMFPQPESSTLVANVAFTAGTSSDRVEEYVQALQQSLREAEDNLGSEILEASTGLSGQSYVPGTNFTRSGDQFALVFVQLKDSDERDIRNPEILAAWEKVAPRPAGLDTLELYERKSGPPGRAIAYALQGADAKTLKQASQELQNYLSGITGVSSPADDLPYGREENLYTLTPRARQLGLTDASLGAQVRAAFAGQLVQIFSDNDAEVEVRVQLPAKEREQFATLQYLPIVTPDGGQIPLGDAVTISASRGFDRLRHENGILSVVVSADVDGAVANATEINQQLQQDVLPQLNQKYGITYQESGEVKEQQETFGDMRIGLIIGIVLIYLVLAWVFNSWGWPMVVIAVIPVGLVGAVFGHWLLGLDMTILTFFGMFALAGIVVNDSIILVVFYREQHEAGKSIQTALMDAARLRLRAVLLTSLTTIGGLIPLLFETSLQAQFLIPMATTLVFGLALATLIVLILVPCLLSLYEDTAERTPAWMKTFATIFAIAIGLIMLLFVLLT